MIYGVIGMPRSGKTTYLGWFLKTKWEKYRHIYVAGDRLLPKCGIPEDMITYIDPYDIGAFRPILGSLFVLCEAGTYFNNRLHAKIPYHCTNFFALAGHYGTPDFEFDCDIVWDSQTADVDKKLRDRTNYLYICKKNWLFTKFSHFRFVSHSIDIDEQTHKIDEIYTYDRMLKRIIFYLTGKSKIMYRPHWYGVFDTHADILFGDDGLLLPEWVEMDKQQKGVKRI